MIPFNKYSQVYNKYCLAYFGTNKHTLNELIRIRPKIEEKLPGLLIYIACNDQLFYLVINEKRTVCRSKLNKYEFGYIREFTGKPQRLIEELEKK